MAVWRESDSEGKGDGDSWEEKMDGITKGENIRAGVFGKIEDRDLDTVLQTWVSVVKVRKQKMKAIK